MKMLFSLLYCYQHNKQTMNQKLKLNSYSSALAHAYLNFLIKAMSVALLRPAKIKSHCGCGYELSFKGRPTIGSAIYHIYVRELADKLCQTLRAREFTNTCHLGTKCLMGSQLSKMKK